MTSPMSYSPKKPSNGSPGYHQSRDEPTGFFRAPNPNQFNNGTQLMYRAAPTIPSDGGLQPCEVFQAPQTSYRTPSGSHQPSPLGSAQSTPVMRQSPAFMPPPGANYGEHAHILSAAMLPRPPPQPALVCNCSSVDPSRFYVNGAGLPSSDMWPGHGKFIPQ